MPKHRKNPRHAPRQALRSAVCATLFLALSQPSSAESIGREHELYNIDPRAAETWAWELCERQGGRQCRVQAADDRELVLFAKDEVHAAVVRLLAERDPRTPPAHGFHVSVLAAKARGDAGLQGKLHGDAAKALDDVRAYLPFSSFEVLGTGGIRTADEGTIWMRESAAGTFQIGVSYLGAIRRLEGLELSLRVRVWQGHGEQQTREPSTDERLLLDTRLNAKAGETVVLGHVQSSQGGPVLLAILSVQP